jgi:hypothetical protein
LSTHSKRTTEVVATETLANKASTNTTDQAAAATGKRTATAKRKTAPPAKGRKASTPPSRTGVEGQKLVCRYCGSYDLAPSFKKRRDARCRACFKQRYDTASRERKGARTQKRQVAAK